MPPIEQDSDGFVQVDLENPAVEQIVHPIQGTKSAQNKTAEQPAPVEVKHEQVELAEKASRKEPETSKTEQPSSEKDTRKNKKSAIQISKLVQSAKEYGKQIREKLSDIINALNMEVSPQKAQLAAKAFSFFAFGLLAVALLTLFFNPLFGVLFAFIAAIQLALAGKLKQQSS